MVKSGRRYRKATPAEIAEVVGALAREELNRERPVFGNPVAAVLYLQQIYTGRYYETFSALFLDTRYQLLEAVELFRGTIDSSSVHPREVVKECLWRGASRLIAAHNHPSGVADASAADIRITEALRRALALIDVDLVDHLIIGRDHYYSLREHGEMPAIS
jgi:DNA repair protein RadC